MRALATGSQKTLYTVLEALKNNRVLRSLSLAIVLSVVAVVVSPAAVLAYKQIDLYPGEAELDSWVHVDGTGFPPSDFTPGLEYYSHVDIYFSSQKAGALDEIDNDVSVYHCVKPGLLVDDHGVFSTRFRVPQQLGDGHKREEVRRGRHYVYVTCADSRIIEAVAEFTVIRAEITLDMDRGPVGAAVDVSGADFAARDDIAIEYDDYDVAIVSGDEETGGDGEFTCSVVIPESTAGVHIVVACDETGNEAEAEFTVEPKLMIAASEGLCSDTVTVEGTGFGCMKEVTVAFSGDEVAIDETDKYGSFEVTFSVPAKGAGTYEVEAKDEAQNRDTVDFRVGSAINLSQTTGHVGSDVTVSGSGFEPDAGITVTYTAEAKVVGTTAADADGRFSVTCIIPASRHGEQVITASDGSNAASATFTMESTPPPAALLLTPETGTRAKSTTYFDWEAVTDASGISYVLQVATDEKFSSGSLVLEKDGLSVSEYVLTKDEKLSATDKESPYYWRVKSVDGAANESVSEPWSFHVGLAFSKLPTPARVVIIVAVVLAVAYVAYEVIRRRSYQ